MRSYYENLPLPKAIMAGLFVGIVDTLICLIFNVAYRNMTGFAEWQIINVSTLIFIINLAFPIIGLLYYYVRKVFPKGDVVFMLISLTGFGLLFVKCLGLQLPEAPAETGHLRTMMACYMLIFGLSSTFGLPWSFRSSKVEAGVI